MKDSGFNFKGITNAKCLFSETVSPKNHGQVCLDGKVYQDTLLVSFNSTSSEINTSTHTGEQISSLPQNVRNIFPTKLRSSFGVLYRRINHVGMKLRALKAKQGF